MEEARKEREILIHDREEIVQALEEYNDRLKTNQAQENERKFQTKRDLLTQIETKRHSKVCMDLQNQEASLHEKQLQDAFDAKHWALEMDRLKL